MKSLNLALQFLTKLPITKNYQHVSDKDLANSVVWYPFVGALYGLALYGVGLIIPPNIPALAIGAILVVVEFLISGGLHYDGLSDLADGWFSGREIKRQLEIMKDSRSGVMGITTLVLAILLKVSLLAHFKSGWYLLICYGFIGKLILVISIVIFPYARKQGTGGLLKEASYKHLLLSLVFIPIIGYVIYTKGIVLVYPLVISLLTTIFIAFNINKRYSGLTGDCYGALHEISQILYLIFLGAFI